MYSKRLILASAIAAAGLFSMSACSGSGGTDSPDALSTAAYLPQGDEISTTPDPALTEMLPDWITEKGTIQIAVDIPFRPMAMYDDDNREIGFDPELARLLGQKLDIEISVNKQAFDSVIPSLQSKNNDIIMSGMNDTPERQETLNFVDYSYGGFGIAVLTGNPLGITGVNDLCGKTVAVQKASVQGDLLRELECSGDPVTVTELPNDNDAQTAVRAGNADAYVADAVVAEYAATTVGDGSTFEIVRDPENPAGFNPVFSGIGILKEETELTEAIRQALQALIDEGSYAKVLERNSLSSYAVESAEINQG